MTHPDFDRWQTKAKEVGVPKPIKVPLHILLGECVEVSNFAKELWQAGDGHLGLESAGSRITRSIADDILSLRRAIQEAQTNYLLAIDPKKSNADLIERANYVMDEITATLEWLLDDDKEEPADQNLAVINRDHQDDSDSADNLAQALHDYATLAKNLQDRMAGLGGFDVKLIGEAFELAEKLGAVTVGGSVRSKEAIAAKLLRDQMSSLLQEKVNLVRSAARFVFRGKPKIVRAVTSSYERRRRAAARRRAEKAAAAGSVNPS